MPVCKCLCLYGRVCLLDDLYLFVLAFVGAYVCDFGFKLLQTNSFVLLGHKINNLNILNFIEMFFFLSNKKKNFISINIKILIRFV